jgi:hypothetical protein
MFGARLAPKRRVMIVEAGAAKKNARCAGTARLSVFRQHEDHE